MPPRNRIALPTGPAAGASNPSCRVAPPAVGGITALSTLDYPGELAAVVFCQGCPWRCRYCHNSHLVPRVPHSDCTWDDVLDLLRRRRGLLDAVVFSGGEPTLQRDLPDAVSEVRAMDFRVGLHTAGCYPERLAALLPSLDWVGLDIKALPQDYAALTGVPDSAEPAFTSLAHVVESGVAHEVRVTVHDALLPPPKLRQLIDLLKDSAVAEPVLQCCRTQAMLDPGLGENTLSWPASGRCSAESWASAGSAKYP